MGLAIHGALLFVVNFLYIAPVAFHAFDKANYPFELFAHLVYGMLLSFAFFGSGIRRGEPAIALQPRQPRWARNQPGGDRTIQVPLDEQQASPPRP